jgi:hypothetical protein
MMTSEQARELGMRPVARVHTAVLAGDDPVFMLTARWTRAAAWRTARSWNCSADDR